MLSRLRTFLIEMSLRLRARTIVPLRSALRRRAIARASGLRQVELRAAYAWWRGEALPAMAFWSELEQAEPQRESWPVKIAQAASERGDFETAERTLLDAQARGIRSEALESNLLRYGRMSRRSNAAVGDAEAIVADPEASPAKVFFSAFYLMAQNRLAARARGSSARRRIRNTGPWPAASSPPSACWNRRARKAVRRFGAGSRRRRARCSCASPHPIRWSSASRCRWARSASP